MPPDSANGFFCAWSANPNARKHVNCGGPLSGGAPRNRSPIMMLSITLSHGKQQIGLRHIADPPVPAAAVRGGDRARKYPSGFQPEHEP